ncbi:MAG TPA: glycoside hydrolase family 9 protein [Planctomycetota bacterium]|nr:glycoside hydrolase family 9 protein [Planctomycetota bacterium]
MRDPTINIAPPITMPEAPQPAFWTPWTGDGATGHFELQEQRDTAPGILRIIDHSSRLAWVSVPRKIEPRREYRVEAELSGSGRLAIRWVRIEKKWISMKEGRFDLAESVIEEVRGNEMRLQSWDPASVADVAPRAATHCRIILETHEPGNLTEFRNLFMDGLGIDLLEIQYSQAGYHPDALKTAVVQFAAEAPARRTASAGGKGGSFYLIDESGKELLEEELEPLEHRTWGRTYWLADFSLFRKEGSYAIVVELGGRRRRTRFFPIRHDAYTRLSELSLQWFQTQRCGIAVPGWHQACHTDDDAAGGWHDGSDYTKTTAHYWMAIHALTHLYETCPPHGFGRREGGGDLPAARLRQAGLPDSLEEARRGAEYLLQIAQEDGRFASYVRPRPARRTASAGGGSRQYIGPAEDETDNAPGTGDEREIGPPCDWTTAALSAYSLANFGRVIEQFQPEVGARCRAAAERTYAALEASKKPDDLMALHSAAALLCIGLWRATGLGKYREECSWRILSILQRQKEEGIFTDSDDYRRRMFLPLTERIQAPDMADPDMGVEYAPAPFLYLQALICYIERSIDDALALEIRGSLDKFLLQLREIAEVSPFGQLGEWTLAENPVNFPVMPRGHSTYYLGCAYLLAKAALLLERDDLASIAQRQLEWVLGRNVRGVCMLVGAGHKNPGACYTSYAAYPEHRSGHQPGGVVNGIIGGDGRDYPIDFPCLDVCAPVPEANPPAEALRRAGRSGLDADPRTNAFSIPNCAAFILACGELTKMLTGRAEEG